MLQINILHMLLWLFLQHFILSFQIKGTGNFLNGCGNCMLAIIPLTDEKNA